MSQHDLTIFANTAILLLAILISVRVGLFTVRRPKIPGTRPFSWIVFLEAAWTLGFLWEMFSNSLPGKIFWDNLQWPISLFLPLAILAFAFEYAGVTLPRPRLTWALLAAIPSLTTLLIFTNAWHGLAIQSIRLVQSDPFSEYIYQFGALLWAGMLYDYLLTLIAIGLLVNLASHKHSVYRSQTLIILLGLFIPVAGTLVTLSGIRIWQFRDLSPITFAIANILVAVGLFRYHIFNLLPLARDLVVESMDDGVIVLDTQERLLDINRSAKKLIEQPNGTLIGLPVWRFAANWLQPADLNPANHPVRKEVRIPNSASGKVIDLRITNITGQAGSLAGYLIILRDRTDHKRVEDLQKTAYLEMERQVAERTAELTSTVKHLETEITERRRAEEALRGQTQNLSMVSRLAIRLAETSAGVDITPLVAENIREVTGALGSVVSLYDPRSRMLSVKQVATPSQVWKTINRLLPNLFDLNMPITSELKRLMTREEINYHANISEITFGAVSESLSRRLLKLLKIGEIISVSLHLEGDLYGSVMIFLPQGAPSPARDMLEAFSHVVSVTLRRNQAEEALRASEVRFRTLLENANDIISVVDSQGSQLFTYYSNNQNRVLGYPSGRKIEKDLIAYIHPDDRDKAREILARIQERPGNQELFELRYEHMDGHWVTLETYAKNLLDDPLIRGIVSTSRDITDRKLAEEEQRRLNRTLTMISRCNLALVRMDDEPVLLETICHVIVEVGGYRLAWINHLQERPVRRLVPTVFFGAPGDPFASQFQWMAGTVDPDPKDELGLERQRMEAGLLEQLQLGQPIVSNDMRSVDEFPIHREQGLEQGILSKVVLPLSFGGELYGSLHIHSSERDAFDKKEVDLLVELANDVSFGIHTRRMRSSRDRAERDARKANAELHQAYEFTLEGWSRALELRERETAGHSQRVVEMTQELAHRLSFDEEACTHIRRGALLHDIGKMGIPDSILLKPAKLTSEDWEIMRQHPDLRPRPALRHPLPGAGADHSVRSPRALGWVGLPAGAERRGNSPAGAHFRRN